MKTEKEFTGSNGYLMFTFWFLLLAGSTLGLVFLPMKFIYVPIMAVSFFCLFGLVIVNPNESSVMVLFGEYRGTIKENGVNDKVGNPIMIGLVLVWKVENTFKAAFEVDEYEHFVVVQSEAALRKLAGIYPYDNFQDETAEVTLRSGGDEVNHDLAEELVERLEIAGIKVIEARINYIAYASEIAGAMLRRQQATAVVAAREKIVEGAVGMVDMALEQLSKKNIVHLDEERKAAMVSNLMVVLCSDESARPVVNTGTLHN
jgi:regulator of protease activity HflC (stomatin/prohibitin superfamily)